MFLHAYIILERIYFFHVQWKYKVLTFSLIFFWKTFKQIKRFQYFFFHFALAFLLLFSRAAYKTVTFNIHGFRGRKKLVFRGTFGQLESHIFRRKSGTFNLCEKFCFCVRRKIKIINHNNSTVALIPCGYFLGVCCFWLWSLKFSFTFLGGRNRGKLFKSYIISNYYFVWATIILFLNVEGVCL